MADQFDFYSEDFQANPGKTFSRMIESCPFHKSEQDGWYSVFRYHDIEEIVRNTAVFSSKFGPGPMYASPQDAAVLVSADPPLHTKQKQSISKAFNPAFLTSIEPDVRQFVRELIDNIRPRRRCDLIQDIAVPVPLWVICKMLDIPYEENRKQLRDIVETLAGLVFPGRIEGAEALRQAKVKEVFDFFTPFILRKIEIDESGGDAGASLLGLLVKARIDGERISIGEIRSFAQFLLVAGSATTTNTIGNFFKLMMEHPDQFDLVKSDPETYLQQAIEEVLRYDAPVHGLFRTNNEPVTLGKLGVPANSKICLMWASANRDPEKFRHPEEFDITRDMRELRQHMTFGRGIHLCMGAPLARMEVRVVVEEFLKAISDIEADGNPVSFPYATLNGLDHLPVKWSV